MVREIVEAYHIRRGRSGCTSAPSIVLLDDEFAFLEARGASIPTGPLSYFG